MNEKVLLNLEWLLCLEL